MLEFRRKQLSLRRNEQDFLKDPQSAIVNPQLLLRKSPEGEHVQGGGVLQTIENLLKTSVSTPKAMSLLDLKNPIATPERDLGRFAVSVDG